MSKRPKPASLPKRRDPIARMVTKIPQQVIPNKKKNVTPKHKPNPAQDWASALWAA
ncbi:hypothetical protein [Magnetococcus marinus]|uniref:hypothetical protein n=1 Tax=Magnetococcus marinus TaxID=1124597 RepID=UPI00003814FC|nr:hypothetical protein [Magnetococcus marinus]